MNDEVKEQLLNQPLKLFIESFKVTFKQMFGGGQDLIWLRETFADSWGWKPCSVTTRQEIP